MSDRGAREWRFYLDDMIGFAEKVIAYTKQLDQAAFIASGLSYDASVRNLELIGEAATRVPDAVRAANPQIPWRMIIATRNRPLPTGVTARNSARRPMRRVRPPH
ncbi:HepT-like ribonuclease domain-containing protein [Aromatoleum anaerobium]|uniref:DUF86 domain-containing protein n=1 Tax=Aromatoleum anaerobium TaxID=182180 RepID=A0ABX1PHQ0_9RHOO|nr:HepT-like ribonuclease domain-containing protein [Aromatoleum anaerobium]MCK0508743.1 DUF86 domain-containing protein [Aromatoleum anaerobium]